MDADGSFDPAQLPRVSGPVLAGEADLVLGRRRSTRRGAWPVHAQLGNAVLAGRLRRTAGVVDYAPRTAGGKSKVTGTVRGTMRAVRDMSRVLAG